MARTPDVEAKSVTLYGLSYIRPRHREIARRLIAGQTHRAICQQLGMSESRFSIIVNSPLFKIELKRLEQERDSNAVDIAKDLQKVAPIAAEVIERTMYTGRTETIRFSAAKDLLDRAGYGAINKSAIDIRATFSSHEDMTDEEMRKMLMDRLKMMQEVKEKEEKETSEAKMIDVEYDEIKDERSKPEQDGKIKVLQV